MSYEKENSAQYVSSSSASAMIAAALVPYVTSNSLSAAFQMGANSGMTLLNTQNLAGLTQVEFSGSWSDIAVLQLKVLMRLVAGATSTTASVAISTNGGGSVFLSMSSSATASGLQATMYDFTVMGGDNRPIKVIQGVTTQSNSTVFSSTVTDSAGFVDWIRYSTSATIANGVAWLFGLRKA